MVQVSRITLILCVIVSIMYSDNYNAGAAMGDSLRGYFSGDFSNTIANPITSDTKMKTVDGVQNFDAKMICAQGATKSAITISYNVNSNGDFVPVIQIDRLLKGQKDYTYSPPFVISGVCANGVVSCSPGTWNNCSFYSWSYNGSDLSLINEQLNMKGCYCTNATCGNLAHNSKDKVLETLGGGINAAISTNNRNFLATKVTNNGHTIEFYGQNLANCNNYGSGLPPYNPNSDYTFNNLETTKTSQLSDANSPYNTFQAATANSQNSIQTHNCTISNNVHIDTDIKPLDIIRDKWLINTDCDAGICDSASLHYQHGDATSGTICLTNDKKATFKGISIQLPQDTIYITWYGNGTPGGTILAGQCQTSSRIDAAWSHLGSCTAGYTPILGGTTGECKKDTPVNSQTNSCVTYENDSLCKIQHEQYCDINNRGCIYTIQNFTVLDSKIPNSCRSMLGQTTSYTFCADSQSLTYVTASGQRNNLSSGSLSYWNIKRTYSCSAKNQFDFNDLKIRSAHIEQTTHNPIGTTNFSYSDKRKDASGNWMTQNISGRVNVNLNQNNLIYCQVKYLASDNSIFSDGTNRSQTASGGAQWKTEIRQCNQNVCPVDASKGEIIKYDCGNINDLAEVASGLETLNQASKDLICSQE